MGWVRSGGITIVLNIDVGANSIRETHVEKLGLIFIWLGLLDFCLIKVIPLAPARFV
jgi:hypothetical protein